MLQKRILPFLLLLALLTTALPAVAQETEQALPAVGEVTHGFEVTQVGEFPLIGARMVLFTHRGTGAQLLYLANDDNNRSFDITFRTPALTDNGVPHVFEHATLAGSEKYPSSTLFYELTSRTYNTFMNAATYQTMTTYPCASLSEAQLLAYADLYMSSVLHPRIYTDPNIRKSEAWRYEMADADAELTLNGTVYNEMKGALTLDTMAYYNFGKTLYPSSVKANVSGGVPKDILTITDEELTAFHTAYYHPSNALIILYGKMDIEPFLALLDEEYLSKYEKEDIAIEDAAYAPYAGMSEKTVEFPVEAGAQTENVSVAYYGFACNGATEEETNVLDLLSTILSQESSEVTKLLRERLPEANVSCTIMLDKPATTLYFTASGINGEDAETFKQAVDEGLKATLEKGVDRDEIDAQLARQKIAVLTATESSSLGVDISQSIAYYWANMDNVFGYMGYVDALSEMENYADKGEFESVIEKYLSPEGQAALAVTVPAPGQIEADAQALKESLAAKKAAMSEEETARMIADTQAFNEWVDAKPREDYVSRLNVVRVDALPEEVREYALQDVTEDGARYISAPAEVGGVGVVGLNLDAGGVPFESLLDLKLLSTLLGQMPTARYSQAALATRMSRVMSGCSISLGGYADDNTWAYSPYLLFNWTALTEDLSDGYDLAREILFDTDLTDAKKIRDTVNRTRTDMRYAINAAPYNINLMRAMAKDNPIYAYNAYTSGLEYYAYLGDALRELDENPDAFTARLDALRDSLCSRAGAIATYAGNEEGIAVNAPLARAFMANMTDTPAVKQDYADSFPVYADREALVVDSAVQFNGVVASTKAMDIDADGRFAAMDQLVRDTILYPELRFNRGAYGSLNGTNKYGTYLISYRDPNVRETFEVYEGIADTLRGMDITQKDMDGYILSAYAGYALSKGALAGASEAIASRLGNIPEDRKITRMRELKRFTPDDLAECAAMYEELCRTGVRFTSGGAAVIAENADLYDAVLDPFGADGK